MSGNHTEAKVEGRLLTFTNLDKVLFPGSGFTKGEMLHYYTSIGEVMLPHVRHRPTTLKRFPNGIEEMGFYEKHSPANTPQWVHTMPVPSKNHDPIEYLVIDDLATLLWAANLAAIEFHVPLWHASRTKIVPALPDYTVFDLDPGPGCTIVECCAVARLIAEQLGEDRIFAKTSGSKGLQLYLRTGQQAWETTSSAAHELAQNLEHDHPDQVVSVMTKTRRKGKVLIDWSQNNPAKTTVAAYSMRARPDATVSTPVSWKEIRACAKRSDAELLRFSTQDVLRRIEKWGDLLEPLLGTR